MKTEDIVGKKLEDKTLKCWDCNSEFTFTAGEQEFFNRRELQTPKRCKSCRERKKTERMKGGKDGQN